MVCEDCKSKLSVISAPDPWRDGSRGGSGSRKLNENKLLRKGVRANPYANACKICKLKTQQNGAIYCTICAYAKGLCAICGKQVLDTSMYKMSEGGNQWHTVRQREGAAFKSEAQMAREEAITKLNEHLEKTGQVGRMPTRAALEQAGHKELAETLVQTYGGLYAAADALGLSKRNLIDEAARRKEAKMQKAQQAAASASAADANAYAYANVDADAHAHADADVDASTAAGASIPRDAPPGIAAAAMGGGAASTSTSASASASASASTSTSATTPTGSATAKPAAASAAAAAGGGAGAGSGDSRWQYDPNSGYYYQLSSGCYYDAKSQMYFKEGKWSASMP